MKKKQYKISTQMLLALALLVAGSWQTAFAFTYNGLNYSVVSGSDKTVEVASQSTSLSGTISIPERVEYNGSSYTVTEIEGNAFIECKKITKIVVPSTVTTIGGGSFAYCSSLETLDLGSGVESIGADLYTGLSSLKKVISRNTTPPTIRNWGTVRTSATLYVPESAIQAYKNASIWSYFSTVKKITADIDNDDDDDVVFDKIGFKNIKTLTVGNLVEYITPGLFNGCTQLRSVKLGSGLKKIGDTAFSGCSAMEEIVVPPSVDSIGASAFAGNDKLASIIMGHSVKVIGEKAYDGCPASTVSITAQTPPSAPNNTFSFYTGKLYVQGEKAVEAYLDAYTCWDRFNGAVMIEATGIDMGDSPTIVTGMPGDTFQLTATLMPENVTLPQVFWRTTNEDIATVTPNGLVTLRVPLSEVMTLSEASEEENTCKIIAESLYADGPVAEVTVNVNSSGIDDIETDADTDYSFIDFSAPLEVYSLQGARVSDTIDNLTPGIYIVRQGKTVKKIAIR